MHHVGHVDHVGGFSEQEWRKGTTIAVFGCMTRFFAILSLPLAVVTLGGCGSQAAQLPAKPGAMEIAGGRFQASGVVQVPGTDGLLFVDDTRFGEIFWMALDAAGTQTQPAVSVPIEAEVIDAEGITTDGRNFYVVSSLSEPRTKTSADLIRFTFDPATKRVSDVSAVPGLGAFLQREVAELREVEPQVIACDALHLFVVHRVWVHLVPHAYVCLCRRK